MRRLFAACLILCLCALSAVAQEKSILDRVLSSKTLRVCIWPDYFGISYRDPKTRQLSGIDIDLARGLARDLGVEIEFVDSSFSQLISDINDDRCDIAMFAIGITPLRQQSLRFTRPHLASDMYAIASKGNRRIKTWAEIDQPGTVVAVARGTLHEPVMREKLKKATLKVFDTPQAREQEVESGRADVFMTDYPFSQRMLRMTDWARLIKPEERYHVTPYAWAMRQGDDRWHARVNAYLVVSKSSGELRAAAARHDLLPILIND